MPTGNDTRMGMLRDAYKKAAEGAEEPEVETPIEEPEVETAEEPEAAATEAEPAAEEKPEGETRGRDDKGRFAATEKPKPGKVDATPKPKPAAAATATPAPKPGTATATAQPAPAARTETPPPAKHPGDDLKAPASWTATARESWAKVPPEARQEIHRLEGETRRVLQRNSELTKSAGEAQQLRQGVEQLISPVSGFFASEGLQPAQGLANLVGTYAALHGPQRNQVLAALITQYGDLDGINAALQGQPAQPGAAPAPRSMPAPAPAQDPRDLIREELRTMAQAAEAQQADSELKTWMATNPEFARDVWQDMQDILDNAERSGRKLTYQQAYDRACKMNEDVSAVIARRAEVAAATAAAAQPSASPAQRARAAAATVRSRPAGGVGGPAADAGDRRAMLGRAMEKARAQ